MLAHPPRAERPLLDQQVGWHAGVLQLSQVHAIRPLPGSAALPGAARVVGNSGRHLLEGCSLLRRPCPLHTVTQCVRLLQESKHVQVPACLFDERCSTAAK